MYTGELQPPTIAPDRHLWPKISIVTPSYNQGQFIEETIRSVLLQGYPNLEYIIIDGDSTDNTVEIIKKYEPWLSYWVSEKDRGQTHAINKGFSFASGVILGFLNSDDVYNPETFNRLAKEYLMLKKQKNFWIAFGVEDFDKSRSYGVVWPKDNYHLADWIDNKAYLHQPGVFWSHEIFKNVGGFDENYNYAFDRKFFVAALLKNYKFKVRRDFVSTRFRHHEDSKTEAVGSVNNLGFAPEFIKISEWAKGELNIRQQMKVCCDRIFPRDKELGQKLLNESFAEDGRKKIHKLGLLCKAICVCPSLLGKRFCWGAIKTHLKKR